MQTLKLLISAYACEPGKGSEPGVGWRWALETAALGHDVWVITRSNNQPAIAKAFSRLGKPKNLHFCYYDLPVWARWWKRGGHGVHLYYLLWQWGAYTKAAELHKRENFQAVHHITFGVTRHPSFMGRLGIPFIVGPLGGGESAPLAARKYVSFAGRVKDRVRDMVNRAARLDPWVRQMYAQASLILMKTPQSLQWLPQHYRDKAQCMLEIGVDGIPPASIESLDFPKQHQVLHVLYVGRFLYWKGMDIGLRALAELREHGIPVRLTMIGQGPEKERWQALTSQLRLANCVTWVPWMQQKDLLRAYQAFDAMLFPSLHDSSGNVVLEAMAGGLPVVCLDIGGPAQLVDASCGRVVTVDGLSAEKIVKNLAATLAELATQRHLIQDLREGALLRAQTFAWRQVITQIWGHGGLGLQAVGDAVGKEAAYVQA